MKIILPKQIAYKREDTVLPSFFLAGPVRGGGDWQHKMCELLEVRIKREFLVAIPCRYTEDHPLSPYFIHGKKNAFERQLEWERFYLDESAFNPYGGCIIFWLPLESKNEPHPGPEPYAMDTRGELGEWRANLRYKDSGMMVLGAHEDFHGLSQISRNFDAVLGCHFPIYKSMADTADAAVQTIAIRNAMS